MQVMSQQLAPTESRAPRVDTRISGFDRILGISGISVGVASLATTGLILLMQSPGETGASGPMGWIAFGLAGLSLVGVVLVTVRHLFVHSLLPGLGWLLAGWLLLAVAALLEWNDFALSEGYLNSYAGLLSAFMGAGVGLASIGLLRGHPKAEID
jgi:hypothetical protein